MKNQSARYALLAVFAGVGFLATSGAYAAITTSSSGNGELFFTVYDVGADFSSSADDRAYVRDLGSLLSGGRINDWVSATTTAPLPALNANKQGFGTSYSIGADSNLALFLTASTDISRLKWNIAAADSSGTDRFLTTAGTVSSAQAPTYTQFRTFANRTDTYLAAMNPVLTGQSALYSGAGASINLWGSNLGGTATFSTSAGFDERMSFFVLSEQATVGGSTTKADVRQFMANSETAMEWTLAPNGDLTYGAIPSLGAPAYYSSPLPGETIDFGTVALGASKDATLNVGNWNYNTMTIYDAKITGEDGDSFRLKNFTPGQTVLGDSLHQDENGNPLGPWEPFHLGIEFDPKRLGEHRGVLTLYTNDVWNNYGVTDGVFSYDLYAVAAIPEPETYAMMLAGLGLLGVMARRRKQKAVA